MDKQIESLKNQLEKKLENAENFVKVEPKEVVRIFDNLMIYGVSAIINCRYALEKIEKKDEQFLARAKEVIGVSKKFSVSVESDGIVISVGGYWRGRIETPDAEPYWLEIDETFSIKKYNEYIKNI